MFFWLSKIMWAVVAPANLATILLGGGVVLGAFCRRAGAVLCGTAFFVLLVFGVFPTGSNLMVWLERHHAHTAKIPEIPAEIDGILVLGGMFETRLYSPEAGPQMNENADRVVAAIRLARAHPNARLVFSGGSGFLTDNHRTEDEDVRIFLSDIGFPHDRVIFENQSRNTYENIASAYALVQPQAGDFWIMVTSAYHMPRAMAVADAAGWGSIIPVATDLRTNGQYSFWPTRFNVLGELDRATVAIKEIIGLYAYRFLGKAT